MMGFYNFPKSISSKVNVLKQLDSELAYNNPLLLQFNPYATRLFT